MFSTFIKLILMLILIFGVLFGMYKYSEWQSDKKTKEVLEKAAKLEKQVETLTADREKYIQQAMLAEEKLKIYEQQSAELEKAIKSKEPSLLIAKEKLDRATKTYEDKIKEINSSNIDNFIRCKQLCSVRAELGYPCSPTDFEIYCKRYATN